MSHIIVVSLHSSNLIEKKKDADALVDAQDGFGYTSLHIAAEKGREWAVDMLLDAHAGIHVCVDM